MDDRLQFDQAQLDYEAAHPAPSTSDLFQPMPGIAGGQDDTLIILESARARYLQGATMSTYVGYNYVCAAGAIMAVDDEGFNRPTEYTTEIGASAAGYRAAEAQPNWEEYASRAAKEALQLVNEAAADLYADEYGEIAEWVRMGKRGMCGTWHFGPIEWLNQALNFDTEDEHGVDIGTHYLDSKDDELYELSPARLAVVRSYDRAIELRKAPVAA